MPMGLEEVVDGALFVGNAFRWRLGVRALADDEWLQHDDARAADLAEKDRILSSQPDAALRFLPGSEPASAELLGLVIAALELSSLTPVPDAGAHPIDRAARSVQEDLCLLEPRSGRWVLTAGSVCFPTRWSIADKIGQGLDAIHGPVPGYPTIAPAVDQFFDRMKIGSLAWRVNWSLADRPDRRLDVADREVGVQPPADIGRDLHLRVERQTLRRLVDHDAICFGIRVHVWPLGVVAQHLPPMAFVTHLESMPAAVARYKNLEGVRGPVVDWLRKR